MAKIIPTSRPREAQWIVAVRPSRNPASMQHPPSAELARATVQSSARRAANASEPTTVTFAIMSDLHCRLQTDPNDSFLTVGALRAISKRHPVEALLDLIDSESIQADALLVPGDLTNKARFEGLASGWDYSLEVGRKLNAPVIPVIGNHDIDSRGTHPGHPADYAIRNLRRGFPFQDDTLVQRFLSDGYCLIRAGGAELLAINTVVDQVDEASAQRGAFGADRIARMEAALQGTLTSPIRGALMHHHPILHSGLSPGDVDVVPTGDELLASLERLGCRFVVHGHKHVTRLSNVNGVAVFASGSFSAHLTEFPGAVGNTFHLFRVQGDTPQNVRGKVRTWVFKYNFGWRPSTTDAGFPHLSGFGSQTPLADVIDRLKALSATNMDKTYFSQEEVFAAVPDAEYLAPNEKERINRALAADGVEMADSRNGRLELWRLST